MYMLILCHSLSINESLNKNFHSVSSEAWMEALNSVKYIEIKGKINKLIKN